MVLQVNIFGLEIVYISRTPYIVEVNKSIEGLVATPVIRALNKAKIKYTLVQRPNKIQLQTNKENKKEICIIGWFKNSYRETFAKYSKLFSIRTGCKLKTRGRVSRSAVRFTAR